MKPLLMAAAAALTMTIGASASAQDVDDAPAPAIAAADLSERADWLEARVHQDEGLHALPPDEADRALDELAAVRAMIRGVDRGDASVADAEQAEDRLAALEDHLRDVDPRSQYWPSHG